MTNNNAVLYKKVRDLILDGFSNTEIVDYLKRKYSLKDIQQQINEVYKDENTNYDEKLIKHLNELLKKHNLEQSINILKEENHNAFEINKAIMRLDEVKKEKNFSFDYTLLTLFIIPLLLGFMYSFAYFFLILLMIISFVLYDFYAKRYAQKTYKNNTHLFDIDMTLVAGLLINQEDKIYSPKFGVLPRFWICNQGKVWSLIFLFIGIIHFTYSKDFLVLILNILNSLNAYILLNYKMKNLYYSTI